MRDPVQDDFSSMKPPESEESEAISYIWSELFLSCVDDFSKSSV